jgi:hypothetical protein
MFLITAFFRNNFLSDEYLGILRAEAHGGLRVNSLKNISSLNENSIGLLFFLTIIHRQIS